MPGQPEFYCLDMKADGTPYYWLLREAKEDEVAISTNMMGHYAFLFPKLLADRGFEIAWVHDFDFRASSDPLNLEPNPLQFVWGAYGGLLAHAKRPIHERVWDGTYRDFGIQNICTHELGIMDTDALDKIPSSRLAYNATRRLLQREGHPHLGINDFAFSVIDAAGRRIRDDFSNLPGHMDTHPSGKQVIFHDQYERAIQGPAPSGTPARLFDLLAKGARGDQSIFHWFQDA